MSEESIRIALRRDDDEWGARVVDATGSPGGSASAELAGREFIGGGPADALERLGQELDLLEVARIRRERGL
jgi:hypothetical protein